MHATMKLNNGKSRVTPGDGWTQHAEQLPGLRMLGVLHPAHAPICGLGVDDSWQYFAVHGRYLTKLVNRKIEASLFEALQSQSIEIESIKPSTSPKG